MKKIDQVTVRVPGTTANLGPGFDTLGVALKIYNQITLSRVTSSSKSFEMVEASAQKFFKRAQLKPFPFACQIRGEVPISRGLGSSVTVRLGVSIGLNQLAGAPLDPKAILSLVIDQEGHPDNALPAFLGGFACAAGRRGLRTPVSPRLKFIALIPDQELETKKARAVLPKSIPLGDAVKNVQNTSLITAAFFTKTYEMLAGAFEDQLHQPARSRLLPALFPVIQAAERAGALGGFLSGAGSTIMAVTLENPQQIAIAMAQAAKKLSMTGEIRILTADNEGVQLIPRRSSR